MRKLARGGGNSSITARDLHRWAHEAMQMGRGKGKRKTAVQGPEYQGLISVDDARSDRRAKRMHRQRMAEVPSWEAGGETPSRPSAVEGARLRKPGPRFVGLPSVPTDLVIVRGHLRMGV